MENNYLKNENEHLKNTLIGLNEKLTVFNDLKKDLDDNKTMYVESESRRLALQSDLLDITSRVKE